MNRGMTLVEVIVIIVVICFLAALFIPPFWPCTVNARITACGNNLSQLYKMAHVYRVQNKNRWPEARGSAFWLSLRKTDPPLIDDTMIDIYSCPVKAEDPGLNATDYRGPSGPLSQYGDNDPVGADIVGNHDEDEGINVLRLAGDVQRIYRDDPLWKACDAKLSEKP